MHALARLAGFPAVDAAAGDQREAGVQLAIVTLGAEGLLAVSGDTLIEMGAEPTEVVDPVGAGDGFTAGLLSALAGRNAWTRADLGRLNDIELRGALAEAQSVAASVCRNLGAAMPWRDDLASSREKRTF